MIINNTIVQNIFIPIGSKTATYLKYITLLWLLELQRIEIQRIEMQRIETQSIIVVYGEEEDQN